MDQSIRVEDAEGKLMFEFSLWALKEFWKGAGRKAEDFYVPISNLEALDLVVLAGLLEPEERAEVFVKLYKPEDWKPMPEGVELFQRDANGEYVRQEPRSEGIADADPTPKEVSSDDEAYCDCGSRGGYCCGGFDLFSIGDGEEERDD